MVITLINGVLNHIETILRKFRLNTRLLIAFIITAYLPLIIIAFIFYNSASSTLITAVSVHNSNETELLKNNIDQMCNTLLVKLNEIATNLTLQKQIESYSKLSPGQRTQFMSDINYILSDARRTNMDLFIMEITNLYTTIFSMPYRIFDTDFSKSELYKTVMRNPNRIVWKTINDTEYNGKGDTYSYSGYEGNLLLTSIKIRNHRNGKTIGLLNIAIPEKAVYKKLSVVEITDSCYAYIIDENNYIVSHYDKNLIGKLDTSGINERILHNEIKNQTGDKSNRYFMHDVANRRKLVSYSISAENGWKIIYVVDNNHLMKDVRRSTSIIVFTIGISLIFIMIISLLVTRSITFPIKNIINIMDKNASENVDALVEDNAKDEIAYMADKYNSTQITVKRLISEVYQTKLLQKEYEFRALEAQINPHFLYNTLDAINWMAFISNNQEISKLVQALSNFFRLSLNGGKEYHTVANEIKHAQSYIQIQKIRFKNKITFDFDVPDNLDEYITLKLLLQPLIENSIKHGLEPKGYLGHIKVIVRKNEDTLELITEDDGVGIAEGVDILSMSNDDGSGYGLFNIDQRLKIYFGDNYGVTGNNVDGGGARVCIKIPVKEKEVGTFAEDTGC